MAYDEALAQRLRAALGKLHSVSEKRMMGGLCLLVNGNMLAGIDKTKAGHDRFMFRVGKDNEAEALSRPGATVVDMGGKKLGGLIFVEADACKEAALKEWITLAVGFVGPLPKRVKK